NAPPRCTFVFSRAPRAARPGFPTPRGWTPRGSPNRHEALTMAHPVNPRKQGLYDPRHEHDACGVGFLVDLKNRKSHDIVAKAIQILLNLAHRGACGCEPNTGDGAGILLPTPHRFLAEQCAQLSIALPAPGQYGVAMGFPATDGRGQTMRERLFELVVREEGQTVLGWRTGPTDAAPLGGTAKAVMPVIRQLFIGQGQGLADAL